MHHCGQRAALTLAVAASLATVPHGLWAQGRDWAINARAGYALPISDLSNLEDAGPTFGIGVERVLEHADRDVPLWTVRLDGDVDMLRTAGDAARIPDLTMFRYTLGVDYWFTHSGRSSVYAKGKIGFGATTLHPKDPPVGTHLDGTFPTLVFGVSAGAGVVFVDGNWATSFATARLAGQFLVPGRFRRVYVLSLRAGVRIPL